MKKILIPVIVGCFIIACGLVGYGLMNRYYIDPSTHVRIDRFTGSVKTLADLIDTPAPTPTATPNIIYTPTPTPNKPKGDISKVVISGDSSVNKFGILKITCTIENKDTVEHNVYVKAIYYDKNKTHVLTGESNLINIKPDDIESVTITEYDNVDEISSYELKVNQSEYEKYLLGK